MFSMGGDKSVLTYNGKDTRNLCRPYKEGELPSAFMGVATMFVEATKVPMPLQALLFNRLKNPSMLFLLGGCNLPSTAL